MGCSDDSLQLPEVRILDLASKCSISKQLHNTSLVKKAVKKRSPSNKLQNNTQGTAAMASYVCFFAQELCEAGEIWTAARSSTRSILLRLCLSLARSVLSSLWFPLTVLHVWLFCHLPQCSFGGSQHTLIELVDLLC